MKSAEYPRVAIVSMNPIRGDQCNGMLMKSLFEGWPRERLAQVYFPTIVNWTPDACICGEYRTIRPWGQVRRLQFSNAHSNQLGPSTTVTSRGSSDLLRRTVASITKHRSLMNWLRPCAELWSANFPLRRILTRQLHELRPDCVYALLGNYHLTKTVYLTCSRLGLPLFTHVTDDFVTAQYEGMQLKSTMQTLSDRWFRKAIKYSGGLAAISPLMAEEFEERYDRKWTWYTTGINPAEYDPTPRQPDGTIRLVYSGNLTLERWQTLRTLALALQALSQQRLPPVKLSVYAPENHLRAYQSALAVPGITELCGWKQPHELPKVFHNSDILVHSESFSPGIAAYTRLSFSTKLSQYMMAGRCLLAVGPAEAGSLRMIARVGAGIVTNEAEPKAIARAIERLIRDPVQRQLFADRGRQWALRCCDRTTAHKRFREELAAIARDRSGGSLRRVA